MTIDPDVRHALIAIAMDYVAWLHYIGVPVDDKNVRDILIHGSNTNYYYDKYSDIDISIIADLSNIMKGEYTIDLFKLNKPFISKWKSQFQHFNIRGRDIDLTVADVDRPEMAPGWYKVGPEYSLVDNCWRHAPIRIPRDELNQILSKAHKRAREVTAQLHKHIAANKPIDEFIHQMQVWRHDNMLANYQQPLTSETLAYKIVRNRGVLHRAMRKMRRQRATRFNVK